MRATSRLTFLLGSLLVAACSSPGQPTASVGPSPSAVESTVPAGNLPPGCEPITLLDPSGARIDLDGTWVEDVPEGQGPMTWWVREAGDCVWGAGTVATIRYDEFAEPGSVQTLRGRIGTDYAIEGEILAIGPASMMAAGAPIYSPVRMLIEFDERGVLLREDRVHGEIGPRCLGVTAFCLVPLVLRPTD